LWRVFAKERRNEKKKETIKKRRENAPLRGKQKGSNELETKDVWEIWGDAREHPADRKRDGKRMHRFWMKLELGGQ